MICDFCDQEIGVEEYSYETGGRKRVKTQTYPLPYKCRRCGGHFCSNHRLPETHDCPMINEKESYESYQEELQTPEIKSVKTDYKQQKKSIFKRIIESIKSILN